MMYPWKMLISELDQWAECRRTVSVWLRDDDAVEPTAQLEQLLGLVKRFEAPLLLAVIPGKAQDSLARRLAGLDHVLPCQHGWLHTNHAPQGEKSAEFGPHRSLQDMLDDIAAGRARMKRLFGERAQSFFVPPWNRISPDLLPELVKIGFNVVSAFRPLSPADAGQLRIANADIDIVDWKGGRVLRSSADVEREIVAHLSRLRLSESCESRLGLLLHHLVHAHDTWSFMDRLMSVFASHTAVRFTDPARL